jgi:hypothetical protein
MMINGSAKTSGGMLNLWPWHDQNQEEEARIVFECDTKGARNVQI